jgi:hypothetical protein
VDVPAQVVPDLLGLDVEQVGETVFDFGGAVSADHESIGPHLPDGLSTPLTVGIEDFGSRQQVVLYVTSEHLGIVLEAGVARSIAADLESAAERVLLVAAR